ncbi:MAG: HAMP domain-containing sensor histidine kinase [bacterium]|nr:HAMP domain-containing sensor histidine kinase [bacterium]
MRGRLKVFLMVEAVTIVIIASIGYIFFNILCHKYWNDSSKKEWEYYLELTDQSSINSYCIEQGMEPYFRKSPGDLLNECLNTFRNSAGTTFCEGTYIIAKCYDENNKLVAEVGDIIQMLFHTEDERKKLYVYPDRYFSPEQMQKIYNLQDKCGNVEVSKLDGYYKGEEFVLTALEVVSMDEERQRVYIENSTDKETVSYTSDMDGLMITETFLKTHAKERPVSYKGGGLSGILEYFVEKYEASRASKIQAYNEAQFKERGLEDKADVSAEWLKGTTGNVYDNEFTYEGKTYQMIYSVMYDCNYVGLIDSWFVNILSILIYFLQFAAIVVSILIYKIYKKKRQLDYAKVVLTNGIAHELKTPLAVIKNYGECILEKINPEKEEYYLSSILKEADQMNGMIVELLNYTRFSNDEYKMKKDLFALDELVDEVLKEKAEAIQQKDLKVALECKGSMEVVCDGALIKMVVENYLSNAVTYTPAHKQIKITLKEERKGIQKQISCKVFNEGSYIGMEQINYIWDVFYRGDKARTKRSGSTGFGLAICKHIVKLHKGAYGCVCKDGGVEFYFTLTKKLLPSLQGTAYRKV